MVFILISSEIRIPIHEQGATWHDSEAAHGVEEFVLVIIVIFGWIVPVFPCRDHIGVP